MEIFGEADKKLKGEDTKYKYWSRLLFEHDFPDWFVEIAGNNYFFYWDRRIRDLRSRQFFWGEWGPLVPAETLSEDNIPDAAEFFLEKLAAVAVVRVAKDHGLDAGPLLRSLEHDGIAVDERKIKLVLAEGPVSHEEEETQLEQLLDGSHLPRSNVSKKHLKDAVDQYLDGTKDHRSLGESRSLLQSLLDDIWLRSTRLASRP
jgi:hypothetical protein